VQDDSRSNRSDRPAYESPTITPVRLDPVRDMLAGCNTKAAQAQCDPDNVGIPLLT
jgi:hypothetical protein